MGVSLGGERPSLHPRRGNRRGNQNDKWQIRTTLFRSPHPPFDTDTFDGEPSFDLANQCPDSGEPVEIPREDGSILVPDLG